MKVSWGFISLRQPRSRGQEAAAALPVPNRAAAGLMLGWSGQRRTTATAHLSMGFLLSAKLKIFFYCYYHFPRTSERIQQHLFGARR